MTLTMVSKQPFSQERLNKAMSMGALWDFPMYVPHVNEAILQPVFDEKMSLTALEHGVHGYSVYPVTDDRPLFYHEFPGLPGSVWEWGTAILGLTVALVGLMRSRNKRRHSHEKMGKYSIRQVAYFSLLGIGYMAVQIPLIEKYLLVLWNPVMSMAVVIAFMVVNGELLGF